MLETQDVAQPVVERAGLHASVTKTVEALQYAYLRSPNHAAAARARGALAQLRKYSSRTPEQQPLALEEILLLLEPPLEERELGKGTSLSPSEKAAFHALVAFGIHMQSATSEAHVSTHSFAWACGRMYAIRESGSIKPRFDAMLLARDEASRMVQLRSLITLLRSSKLAFHYGYFASDLRVLLQTSTTQGDASRRQGVLLRWGRDFAAGASFRPQKS
ncbi:type I-E CRISPR-associated protein Cse2/CasB [Corynebacterium sp. 32222D000AT]|uniref:type I-E CRISPR-associated protein Cse2/CasB n=1 Tax=unclassified Corynebacterium TaxID=2624378 RepID=UPI002A9B29BC|nr:type I-E CRISPR-associated protein Cse2/CasB [Mycobacteriaceae bacterium]MDY5830058.1 type I-E CRISPR-associated protein Cse2/CasB [Corynebacterium sp.]